MDKFGKKELLKNPNCQDSIFVGLCSLALLVYSIYHHFYDHNTSEWKTSPYLFPTLVSAFGILLAFSLLADALHDLQAFEKSAESAGQKQVRSVLVLIGASLIYYVLLPIITFIPATMVFLLALFVYLGERTWWKLLLLSGITTGVIYVLFGIFLNVRLP